MSTPRARDRRGAAGVEQWHAAGRRVEVSRLRVAIPALLHPEARCNPRGVAAVEKRDVAMSEVPEQPPGAGGGGTGAGVVGNHPARATHAVPAHRLTKCCGTRQAGAGPDRAER